MKIIAFCSSIPRMCACVSLSSLFALTSTSQTFQKAHADTTFPTGKQASCRETMTGDELDSDTNIGVNEPTCAVPKPPIGNGGPPEGGSGGPRPACPAALAPLDHLQASAPAAPQENTFIEDAPRWGLTAHSQPSLWFYSPYKGNARSLKIEIETWREVDTSGPPESVLESSFSPPDEAGLVGIRLPESLEPNRWYKVTLNAEAYSIRLPSGHELQDVCRSGQIVSESSIVWVMYQPLVAELSTQLDQTTAPGDRISLLAEANYWHDAMAEAVNFDSQSLERATLPTLLGRISEINAEFNVAGQPVLDCCNVIDEE